MTTRQKIYVALVLGILLSCCFGCQTGTPTASAGDGNVFEIKLSDGTRCAIYDGYYSGGIDCDWRRE